MDHELLKKIEALRQQVRSARQVAQQCRQRTALLVAHGRVLQARFEQLEYKMLLREAAYRQLVERSTGKRMPELRQNFTSD